MVEEKLLEYVEKAIEKGFSLENISKLLKRYGYSERDIDEAIWVLHRDMREREEKRAEEAKKEPEIKKGTKKKEKNLEKSPMLSMEHFPEMPGHIEPKRFEAIPEIETKVEKKIEQKFFPEKENKKHLARVIAEIILGIILFALVGILMYIYMWPLLLNVR